MGLFGGNLPYKVDLKYKVKADGSIVLKVDPVEDVLFMWEYCPPGTINWQYIHTSFVALHGTEIELGAGTADLMGSKFRCIGYFGNPVACYSSVLTITQRISRKADQAASDSFRESHYNYGSYSSSGGYSRRSNGSEKQSYRESGFRYEGSGSSGGQSSGSQSSSGSKGGQSSGPTVQVFSWFQGCSTWDQIQSRYRQLMKQHHPDRGGSEETAKEINEQFDELKKLFGK